MLTKKMIDLIKSNTSLIYILPKEELTSGDYAALIEAGVSLGYVPKEDRTLKLCLISVKKNRLNIFSVPEDDTYREVFELYVCEGGSLIDVPKKFYTKSLVLEHLKKVKHTSVSSNLIGINPTEIENLLDEKICYEFVRCNPSLLHDIPVQLRTKEICDLALEQSVWAIKDIPKSLLSSKLVKSVFERNMRTISVIPHEYITKEMLAAASKDKTARSEIPMKYLSEEERKGRSENKIDSNMAAIYALVAGLPFSNLPENYKDESILAEAIKKNPNIFFNHDDVSLPILYKRLNEIL